MILLGSIQRIELVRILVEQISSEKRRKEATRRHLEALRYSDISSDGRFKHWLYFLLHIIFGSF